MSICLNSSWKPNQNLAPNSLAGLSQFQYRFFHSRSRLWCFPYTEYKKGNKLVVSVHQESKVVGYFFPLASFIQCQ